MIGPSITNDRPDIRGVDANRSRTLYERDLYASAVLPSMGRTIVRYNTRTVLIYSREDGASLVAKDLKYDDLSVEGGVVRRIGRGAIRALTICLLFVEALEPAGARTQPDIGPRRWRDLESLSDIRKSLVWEAPRTITKGQISADTAAKAPNSNTNSSDGTMLGSRAGVLIP